MAGVLSGNHLLLLVQHAGISRAATWSALEPRWPDVVLADIDVSEPSAWLTVGDAAVLARRRRGIEPLRIVILPQVIAMIMQANCDEPMPMLF